MVCFYSIQCRESFVVPQMGLAKTGENVVVTLCRTLVTHPQNSAHIPARKDGMG